MVGLLVCFVTKDRGVRPPCFGAILISDDCSPFVCSMILVLLLCMQEATHMLCDHVADAVPCCVFRSCSSSALRDLGHKVGERILHDGTMFGFDWLSRFLLSSIQITNTVTDKFLASTCYYCVLYPAGVTRNVQNPKAVLAS